MNCINVYHVCKEIHDQVAFKRIFFYLFIYVFISEFSAIHLTCKIMSDLHVKLPGRK